MIGSAGSAGENTGRRTAMKVGFGRSSASIAGGELEGMLSGVNNMRTSGRPSEVHRYAGFELLELSFGHRCREGHGDVDLAKGYRQDY